MADPVETQIQDAFIARLNATIKKSGGYFYDLDRSLKGGGAHDVVDDFEDERSPQIVVDFWKADEETVTDTHVSKRAQVHLELRLKRPTDTSVPLRTHLQRLVADVNKCLAIARDETPVFAIAACEDLLLLGHTKIPWGSEEPWLTALMECQVKYEHLHKDPTAV